jgi:hypothetical protein
VRKLKSMDWDRIRIFPEAARTGMRVNRQHMDVNRASMVHSLFPDFIGGPPQHDYRPSLSAERKQRDSSNHFGRYRLSERFVGHNKKWLATTCRRLYPWRWLR